MNFSGTWSVSLETGEIQMSDEVKEILSISHDGPYDIESIINCLDESFHDELLARGRALVEEGIPYIFHVKLKASKTWIGISCNPMSKKSGEVVALLGVVSKINTEFFDECLIWAHVGSEIIHELMGPFTIVKNNAKNIITHLEQSKIERVVRDIKNINQAVSRVEDLFREMRAKVRNEEQVSMASLDTLIKHIDFFASERLRERGIEFSIDNRIKNQDIAMNQSELLQVFTNLIQNSNDALEYLFEKWIKLEITEDDKFVMFYFTDSGKGIPERLRFKIFDRLFTTKEETGGTGIGLDLCKRMLNKVGGDIKYVDDSQNTTFLISVLKL